MRDPVQRDWDTVVHEAAHAVACTILGGHVVRVIAHRHHARSDAERGSVEWLAGDLSPFDEATVLFAGRIAAEGFDALVDAGTPDEQQAREVCPLGWKRARSAAWMLFRRRDTQRALRALVAALEANDYVMPGPDVRRVIAEALAHPEHAAS